VKIRLPLVGFASLTLAAILLAAPGSPARAVSIGGHWMLMNTLTLQCAVEKGSTTSLYTTACPDASRTDINHSLLWYQNGYNEIVNYHSDYCMIVTGETNGSSVWVTPPTSAGSGVCNPVTVDEWTPATTATYQTFQNSHSHLYMTGTSGSTAITQNSQQSSGQYWDLVPTNS
jgi:hypothetical protein